MRQEHPFGELSARGGFDHYARLVRQFVDVPVALVTLVEPGRQVFPGVLGLPEPYLSARQTPLSHSFCQYVVADDAPLVVSDARLEARLADSDAIADLGVIAYAGWPVRDTDGTTIGSLCAIDHAPRDWTEAELEMLRDLAQACSAEVGASLVMVRDTERLTQAIFESVDVALAFYDSHDRLVMANDLAERAVMLAGFRLDRAPYAGEQVRQADNQTPIRFEDQIIPRALRGDLENHEMEWIGPPGRQIAIVASARTVHRDDGTLWGTLIAAHDVTELARALQVKDEFVGTVSHELRTPLTSLVGNLALLQDELDSPNDHAVHSMRAIMRNAERLHERIAELLESADRRRVLDLKSIDVSILVERVTATFAQPARLADLDLDVDLAGAQHALIDLRRIEQAIENVLANAVKYTPAGGRIEVTCTGDTESVTIIVADNGVGMTPDEVAQAFDTFWRADGARQSAVQGIGLGLSLVHDVIAAHNGTATIDSIPGEGTRVTLRIPRACA